MKKRIEGEPILGEDVELGDLIEDKAGQRGVVVENMHPWGFLRWQYSGLTVIDHPDKTYYRLIKKHD